MKNLICLIGLFICFTVSAQTKDSTNKSKPKLIDSAALKQLPPDGSFVLFLTKEDVDDLDVSLQNTDYSKKKVDALMRKVAQQIFNQNDMRRRILAGEQITTPSSGTSSKTKDNPK